MANREIDIRCSGLVRVKLLNLVLPTCLLTQSYSVKRLVELMYNNFPKLIFLEPPSQNT